MAVVWQWLACDFNIRHPSKDLTGNLWNVDLVHIKVIETVLEFHVDLIWGKNNNLISNKLGKMSSLVWS